MMTGLFSDIAQHCLSCISYIPDVWSRLALLPSCSVLV